MLISPIGKEKKMVYNHFLPAAVTLARKTGLLISNPW